jgi:DNA-binding MarR family transcriptional regulator
VPNAPLAAELDLASALRIPVMRLSRRLRAEGADEGLTLSQLAALSTLDRHGPMAPGTLADHERVQPPSISRILTVLEERGLVVRRPHATDRRQHVIELTGAGRALVAENRRRKDAWLSQQLQLIAPEELEALRAVIPILDRLGLA